MAAAATTKIEPFRVVSRARAPRVVGDKLEKTGVQLSDPFEGDDNVYHSVLCPRQKKSYNFDAAFGPNASQETVFKHTCRDMVDSVFDGVNYTFMAYGQTGSGKTYSTMGRMPARSTGLTEAAGVIPRAVHAVYARAAKFIAGADTAGCRRVTISVGSVQVYLDKAYDLTTAEGKEVEVREKKLIFVIRGHRVTECATSAAAMKIVQTAADNRATAKTGMNTESSRSHAILFLRVKTSDTGANEKRSGLLTFVDLAGSERQSDTGAIGLRLSEAAATNRSLLVLGNVFAKLVQRSTMPDKATPIRVPYHDSLLTRILKRSLDGNCRTVLLVTYYMGESATRHTINTLDFGTRARKIKSRATANVRALIKGKSEPTDEQKDMTVLESQLDTLRGQRSELEKMVAKNDKTVAEQRRETDHLRAKLASAETELVATKRNLEKAKKEMTDVVTAAKRELAAVHAATARHKATEVELQQCREKSRAQISSLEQEIAALMKAVAPAAELLRQNARDHQRIGEAAATTSAALVAEVGRLRDEISSLRATQRADVGAKSGTTVHSHDFL